MQVQRAEGPGAVLSATRLFALRNKMHYTALNKKAKKRPLVWARGLSRTR
jgi:hypothetical protein